MSNWTYVSGTIKVDVMGRTQEEAEYILKTVIRHLPIVTGSETDMEIYINKSKYYESASSHNEFGIYCGVENHTKDKGWYKMNNSYILTLEGNLRDRDFEETYKEVIRFLCRLGKRVRVQDVLIRIADTYKNKRKVIDEFELDNNPYYNMWESPSWHNEESMNWCEYLMWEQGINTNMPMKLEYKYYKNEENDKEVKKRLHRKK